MDVCKRFCGGDCNFFLNKGGLSGILCRHVLLPDLLGSQHLLVILQTSVSFKNSENVVKSGCFEKRLWWKAPTFFRNKGGI